MNKNIFGLWIVIVLLLAACQESTVTDASQNTESNQQPSDFVILALGDSLTEGLGVPEDHNYPAILQQQLQQQGHSDIRVVNAGLSGETSTGLLNRLDWVMQLQPDLTLLTIGANDAMRGLDLSLTENNIRNIIKTLQKNNSAVILSGMEIYDNLGREYVSGFKAMYPRIAKDLKIGFIPFFLQGVAGQPQYNQADGIHPNQLGYQVIVENNILPAVINHLTIINHDK
ncbi:MAG: arylesterase [Proteobacteria bacterium]|nr:MAG: arylesterase [Pseudomonadota bacterium]